GPAPRPMRSRCRAAAPPGQAALAAGLPRLLAGEAVAHALGLHCPAALAAGGSCRLRREPVGRAAAVRRPAGRRGWPWPGAAPGRGEEGYELVDEGVAQALERLDGDGVLEACQDLLAGQVNVVGGAAGNQPEDGVGAQGVVVVLVLVVGEDAVDAAADHLQEG